MAYLSFAMSVGLLGLLTILRADDYEDLFRQAARFQHARQV